MFQFWGYRYICYLMMFQADWLCYIVLGPFQESNSLKSGCRTWKIVNSCRPYRVPPHAAGSQQMKDTSLVLLSKCWWPWKQSWLQNGFKFQHLKQIHFSPWKSPLSVIHYLQVNTFIPEPLPWSSCRSFSIVLFMQKRGRWVVSCWLSTKKAWSVSPRHYPIWGGTQPGWRCCQYLQERFDIGSPSGCWHQSQSAWYS